MTMKHWPLIKILPVRTHFRFVRLAKYTAPASTLVIIGSLFLTLFPFKLPCGGLKCGIDFKGGSVLELTTAPKPADVAQLRGIVSSMHLGDVQVQGFGSPDQAMIRFQTPEGADPTQTATRVEAQIAQSVSPIKFTRADVVGPKVSGELLRSGLLALGGAILLMLLYIWFRFELEFGLGAVAALFHDVILTFGMIALTGRLSDWTGGAVRAIEFDLPAIAAILTIIGYSMNDTVVVFDRFRENLRKFKKMSVTEVIDLSINEMLTRTIITSFTAIIALIVLAVYGGRELYGLSVIMLFGIVIGTYSSIYIAAPIILLWGVKPREEAEPIPPAPGMKTSRR
jgi:preprotein translocase SecF subunit